MHVNVSGVLDTAIVSPGDNMSDINTIHIANTHATDEVLVDLYISLLSDSGRAASTFYLMKGHKIEKGEYINLNSSVLSFYNGEEGMGLYVVLNNSDSSVDVLVK
tara:strand:- start:1401 stop:1715 length:315 start_codon:yes stop_codon:yes gene_type:complete